jgi:hypothetical protein
MTERLTPEEISDLLILIARELEDFESDGKNPQSDQEYLERLNSAQNKLMDMS